MRQLFTSEVKENLVRQAIAKNDVFKEEDIANLPDPVQKFFTNAGYLGRKMMANAELAWKDVYLKTSPDKDWAKIECYQYNAVAEPTRMVYMKSHVAF